MIQRVALSGYTDSKEIYKALEENIAKMYLFKPWDNAELVDIVRRLAELEDLLKDKKILELINNINNLPTVPSLYSDISRLIRDDEDVDRISRKIEEDPSITSRILRVANSAFYGGKTGSINQAIMYIGLGNVKNIVLSNAVFESVISKTMSQRTLWNHANLTNKLTSYIYQKYLDKKIPTIFASSGLLHDIGKVVMFSEFDDEYGELIDRVSKDESLKLIEEEKKLFGITHQEIGGYLLNWWEIPLPIVETALFHHDPLSENVINKELTCVVHIANYYSWLHFKKPELTTPISVEAIEYLGLDQEELHKDLLAVEFEE